MAFVHLPTDQVVYPGQGFVFEEVQYPNNWTPDLALSLGFVEITEIDNPPADRENYDRDGGNRSGAVCTYGYVHKSDEQVKQIANEKVKQQITNLEMQNLVSQRALRDALGLHNLALITMGMVLKAAVPSAGAQLDQIVAAATASNVKIAAVEAQLSPLRAKIVP